MMKIFRIELYKLRRRPAFWISCGVLLLLTIGLRILFAPSSSLELITSLTIFAPLFAIYEAVSIARRDYVEQTTKNYLTAGYSRSAVFFGKMFASIHAALVYFLIEAVVSIALIFLNGFAIKLGAGQIAISVCLQLIDIILYAIFAFSVGYVFIKSVWSIIATYGWITFGPALASFLCSQYKIPIELGDYILGGVSYDPFLFKTSTLIQEGIIIASTLIFMIVACVISGKREIKE